MRPSPGASLTAALYNESDARACAVLRQCIADGVIAPGDVAECSIKDLTADDIRGYTQFHAFAGGGLWSVAARMAGWPDDRPLWTASCPCQPFSGAGKGLGADDPRHLWPDLFRLVRECRAAGYGPPVLVGEQVSGKAGYGWFDGVSADLATEGFASRARDIPACAVDAPHQRNRLYWIAVAYSEQPRITVMESGPGEGRSAWREGAASQPLGRDGGGVTQGEAVLPRLEGLAGHGDDGRGSEPHRPVAPADGAGAAGHVVNGPRDGWREGRPEHELQHGRLPAASTDIRRNGSFWSDAEWVVCHDGKARRAQPGVRLLVDGLPGRIHLWRIAGNAIVPQVAAEVLSAFLDAERAAS